MLARCFARGEYFATSGALRNWCVNYRVKGKLRSVEEVCRLADAMVLVDDAQRRMELVDLVKAALR